MYKALEEVQFELYYQPKVVCKRGKYMVLGGLARWRKPDEGIIANFFIFRGISLKFVKYYLVRRFFYSDGRLSVYRALPRPVLKVPLLVFPA